MFYPWQSCWLGIISVGLILLLPGCGLVGITPELITPKDTGLSCQTDDFADNFAQLEPGASRAVVRECLGQPAEVNEYELPETPFYGPSESLASILKPETPVEEWLYYAADQTYYLWFASHTGEPRESWRLVGKASYPTGAVFEAE